MEANAAPEQSGRILVVDDTEEIRDLLALTLTSHNYSVVTAENGLKGFEALAANPDICFVISDLDMPVLNGFGMIQKIREAKYDVPIAVLTGRKDVASAIRVIHAGADDFIVKDENIQDEILLHTRKVFEKRKIEDEVKRLNARLTEANQRLEMRNQFIRKTFGRYLSDEVVEKLLESPDGLRLGGETLPVTVLMSDLRGFSAISEGLPPETVVRMLNAYLKEMTDVIFKYSGTINEIVGDAMLVLFGAPTPRPDDADRALACALEMQLTMEKVNARNREEGLPELEMGIGMNTGPVIAGNVGSDIRVKYAVVGTNVNLAGRVESYTVGGQVLATEQTLKAVSLEVMQDGEFTVRFKGFEKPATVYEVTGVRGKYNLSLPVVKSRFIPLEEPLHVEWEGFDGKFGTGEKTPALITLLAEKGAVMETATPLELHANLKFSIAGRADLKREAYIYAKVAGRHESGGWILHFTFVPRELRELLDSLTGGEP